MGHYPRLLQEIDSVNSLKRSGHQAQVNEPFYIMKHLTILCLLICQVLLTVSIQSFYPYGGNSAISIMENVDDGTYSVSGGGIPFCRNGVMSTIYISTNGYVTINHSYGACCHSWAYGTDLSVTGKRIIAPLFIDIRDRSTGSIYYETYNNIELPIFSRANQDIRTSFSNVVFSATKLHLITWYKQNQYSYEKEASFQLAIISDMTKTYIRMAYGFIAITVKPALVGYHLPDGISTCMETMRDSIPSAFAPYLYPFQQMTGNYGEQGVWWYDITPGGLYKMRKSNTPITYARIREEVLSGLKEIGLDTKLFGIHSLRSGGATAAANKGIKDGLFKRHGRWKTESVKDGYIKDDITSLLSVSRGLGL